jgi:hypothetical protein
LKRLSRHIEEALPKTIYIIEENDQRFGQIEDPVLFEEFVPCPRLAPWAFGALPMEKAFYCS